ncbi:MAG: DUF3267 domain-containing protein [Candidatus Bathyarchaeota archaeon]|nr:DUF3267 domain-containing protein [Candidatus Bathyarchaeota archaeon]
MNTSTKTLPEGYVQSVEINLKKNKRLALKLNIAGLPVMILSFFLFSSLVALARPSLMDTTGTVTAGVIVVIVGLTVTLLTIHELVHGFFFWAFTRSRPVFDLHLFYACAGAPDWYIPARKYAVSALGPLVIIDAVGFLLMLLVPLGWVLAPVYMMAMNTAGSTGDLYILTRVLKLSPTSLVNDTGDVVTFYEHISTISNP